MVTFVIMIKFTIRLAIDITDENGCTGLQIASANGHVSKRDRYWYYWMDENYFYSKNSEIVHCQLEFLYFK